MTCAKESSLQFANCRAQGLSVRNGSLWNRVSQKSALVDEDFVLFGSLRNEHSHTRSHTQHRTKTHVALSDAVLANNKSGGYVIPGQNGGRLQVEMHHLGDKSPPSSGTAGGAKPTVRSAAQQARRRRRRRATDDGMCDALRIARGIAPSENEKWSTKKFVLGRVGVVQLQTLVSMKWLIC